VASDGLQALILYTKSGQYGARASSGLSSADTTVPQVSAPGLSRQGRTPQSRAAVTMRSRSLFRSAGFESAGGELGVSSFILLFSLFNAIVFQWPLYRLAVTTRATVDVSAGLAIVTLFVLQLVITVSILGLTAMVSVRLLKTLCIFFTVGNAVALYFIAQYNIIVDSTMIGNIVNTNIKEASDLAHPKLLVYLLLLGMLPALVLFRIRIRKTSRIRRGLIVVITLVLGSGWLYANAQSWLWIDKNAKQFGGLILPWSYVINTVRYFRAEADRNRVVELLPPLTSKKDGGVVFVLVIGEAARAQNFSLYGYPRETNPLLKRDGVVAIPGAHSCATYTTASLRCMLSHKGASAISANDEPLPSYLHRHGVEVIWRTNNFGEPPMKVSRYESAEQIRKGCTQDCARLAYDEVLLDGLGAEIHAGSDRTKTLIVLHQAGSHGPLYSKKYPPEFEKFKPACESVELQKCSSAELVSAYDNTIVYNDFFLHRLIQLLKSDERRPVAMMYMSDHGESLGEGGLYLHGVPNAFAPDVQRAVPLLVWMSDEFVRRGGGVNSAARFGKPLSHDVVFHSVMGAMGLGSPVYARADDLFQAIESAPSIQTN
jgi:lipid A ethanolaminephosphotransferase